MMDTIFFQMEYQRGIGRDWTQRKASVHNCHDRGKNGGFVLYTSTVGLNHEPKYFADMGEAVAAAMAFAHGTPTPTQAPKPKRRVRRG